MTAVDAMVGQWVADSLRVLFGFGAFLCLAGVAVVWHGRQRYRAGRRDRDEELQRFRFRMVVRREQARLRLEHELRLVETVPIPRQRAGDR